MRSGVIAQKLGMTRIFTDAGEHVPVTVLKLDNCQVVGPADRRKERLHRVQLGAGMAKVRTRPRLMRGHFAIAKVEPKRKVVEFRVSPDNMVDVGEEIIADHFCRSVRRCVRHVHRQGLCRCHEAPQLRRSARLARRVHLAPFARFDRSVPGPGQGVQGQEDGRSHGQ
jgi:hypothetical protein